MARKGYGRNSTLVNTTTHADDNTSPVGSNEWNENPKKDGIFGLTKSAQTISGNNNIVVTDSYIEITTEDSASGGSNDGIYTLSAGTAVLTPANYPSDTDGGGSGSSISEGDLIYVVKAASQGTTSLVHQQGGSGGAGKITTLTAGNKELSATVPTILMARTIGSVLEWVEYGGGTASDLDTTNFSAAGLVTASDTIASNDNDTTIPTSAAVKDFAEARANHTGTQAASTITNFATEVGNTTAVAANTLKTGITSGQASDIASNKTLLGATAGTVSADKALIVDASKDLTGINDLTIAGDLTVSGTSTTVNVETLTVDTAAITIMNGNTTAASANDSGIKTQVGGSAFKTLLWKHATSAWTSSDNIDSTEYKIAGTTVLSGSTLGSTITGSSLTSVGAIGIGSWAATDVAVLHGGTGSSTASDARTALGVEIGTDVQAFNSATALTTNKISDFAACDSSELIAKISDETGTGLLVFGTDPTITLVNATGLPVAGITTTSGTASSSTFLRGDGQWQSAGGGTSTTVDCLLIDNADTNTVVPTYSARTENSTSTPIQIYVQTIDSNNEGVYIRVKKNGTYTNVQIA